MLAERPEARPSASHAGPVGVRMRPVDIPDVRYARTGGVVDRVPVGRRWAAPRLRAAPVHDRGAVASAAHPAFLDRLAERLQLIVFNPRGTGLSDRPRTVTLESRMDDITAVLDATGLDRASLFGVAESANVCALFASTYPGAVSQPHPALAVRDDRRGRRDEERLGGAKPASTGGNGPGWRASRARSTPPTLAIRELMDWFVWMQRAAVSPNGAAEFTRMQIDTDIGDVLPTHQGADTWSPTLRVRALRRGSRGRPTRIPNATAVSLPSEGIDPYTDADAAHRADHPRGARRRPCRTCRIPCSRPCCSPISSIRRRWPPTMGDRAWKDVLGRSTTTTFRRALWSVPRHRGRQRRRRLLLPIRRTCTRDRVREGDRRPRRADRGLQVRAGVHTGRVRAPRPEARRDRCGDRREGDEPCRARRGARIPNGDRSRRRIRQHLRTSGRAHPQGRPRHVGALRRRTMIGSVARKAGNRDPAGVCFGSLMRLVTYDRGGHRRLGAIIEGEVVDLPDAVGHPAFPSTLDDLVSSSRGSVMDAARAALQRDDAWNWRVPSRAS